MELSENLIFNMPFDESAGSVKAYDYSKLRHDATIIGAATFGRGRQGNCIEFSGEGSAEVDADVINLASDFTLTAWLKRPAQEEGYKGAKIGVFCNCAGVDNSRSLWVDINAETWGYWAIVKTGTTVRVYLDTKLRGTLELPGVLAGFSILQDIYGTEYGVISIDEVQIYNKALNADEIGYLLSRTAISLQYYINGVNFRNWDVRVSDSKGLLDRPALKKLYSVEWPDEHGEVVDLSGKRFEAREITLSCFIKANSKIDFVTKLNAFLEQFSADGTQRLMVEIHPTKPLVYEVYLPNSVAITKRWNDALMVGSFTIKLREPQPVKRVVRHQMTGEENATLEITLTSRKLLAIHWGDGTADYDINGTARTISHTYKEPGIYYALIDGVIEQVTDFETNGIVVWSKL